MKNRSRLLSSGACAVFCATVVSSSDAAPVEDAPNNSWVSVSGSVVATTPDTFVLDYSGGTVVVEMDDFDFYKEGRNLLENDRVVVHGKIDDDLFEARTIEASSVYVQNLSTHFYAGAADEEDFAYWSAFGPVFVGQVVLTGYVTNVDGRMFTINNGLQSVRVDTGELPFNPMDDKGYLKVDMGDFVKVSGKLDASLFSAREVDATWITELQ